MNVYLDTPPHFECPACRARIDSAGAEPFSTLTCPACAMKAAVPGQFGHYTLLERLGEGGIGPVFRARDTKLNRTVALKVLHKVLSLNHELVDFFRDSARSAANLNHVNVMKVFELGREGEQHYITMELIDGRNLREVLYSDTLGEQDLLTVGLGIAQGLEAAHATGLVHGDVRPKNIFITREGVAKVSDFGLARSISRGSSRPDSWVSPYFTAPERLGGGEDTMQSDMYGLGATLYQAAAGRPPFDDPDTARVLELKASREVPDVREARPDLRPGTAAIIHRLLRRDPADRFASYEELIHALQEAIAGGEGQGAVEAGEERSRGVPDSEAGAGPAPARRRSRLPLLLLALALAAAAAWHFFGPGFRAASAPAEAGP